MTPDPPAFGDAIDHQRIDADRWDEIYVVGDVHGCIDELEALVERIDPAPEDLLVFVGDLVRKGPASSEVLEWVRRRPNARTVLGNNERKLLRGDATLPELSSDQESYVAALPEVISFDDVVVVHGGLDPSRPLAEHDPETVATMRSTVDGGDYDGPFWFEDYDGEYTVCFGHTVLETPLVTDTAVGLDTGCVYGGSLTAYRVATGELIDVDGQFDAWHRDDDSIVDGARLRRIATDA